MTSITTIIVMVPMVIMAGDTIREFVLPLMVGVLAGTYSSICVCSPLYFELGRRGRTSEYEKQVKEAKKRAKRKAKEKGIPYVDPEVKKAEKAKAKQAAAEAKALKLEENGGVDPAAANKKRSKRYVKGNKPKTEVRQEDSFKL